MCVSRGGVRCRRANLGAAVAGKSVVPQPLTVGTLSGEVLLGITVVLMGGHD